MREKQWKDQMELLLGGEAYARSDNPETSYEAAASMRETGAATRLEQVVLNALSEMGGGSLRQVSDFTEIPTDSLNPRFAPLARKNLIYADGMTKNPSGRKAILWRVS